MFRKYFRNLKKEFFEIRTQRGLLHGKLAMRFSCIVLLFALLMTLMNFFHGYYLMTVTTLFFTILSLFSTVFYHKNKYLEGNVVFFIGILFLFSFYAITEQNNGFAILWIMLFPSIVLWLIGFRNGIMVCLYFALLLIVMFYTPLRAHFTIYSTTFMDRFPILYLCSMVISTSVMFEYQRLQSRQKNYQAHLEKTVQKERKRVSDISLQTILSISNAVDAKDKYTSQHSVRVAAYCRAIARKLGWKDGDIDNLNKIALLHDIGKIGIDDAILNKPSRLTEEEYEIMKQHTTIGAKILKELTILPNVALGAKYHHERYDGKGYPNGLQGEAIPIEARIIGIADAYDAMNTNRSYRKACDAAYIRQELLNGKGTQFDPKLVDIFLEILDEKKGFPAETPEKNKDTSL